MRFLVAGVLSVAVLGFAGTGFVAWNFHNHAMAYVFWAGGCVTACIVTLLLWEAP